MRSKKRSVRAEAWQRWYKTARWKRLREAQLRRQPLCECPHCKRRMLPANVVDHAVPHQGDRQRFWDRRNLRSMNKACHDKMKQSEERGGPGFLRGVDAKGWPLSRDHEWNEG